MPSSSRSRRRSLFWVSSLCGLAVLLSGALYLGSQPLESDTTREVAPGLTLRAVQTQTPSGPLRYWLVTAKPDAFSLNLVVPDATDAQKKRSVRGLAAQSGALVAVNGGFFAYGGAAVGAVKVDGRWQRLPWKSRTALGWNSANDTRIGPLTGSCQLRLETRDGQIALQSAAFNGFTLPGERDEVRSGFAVLTPMFARTYTLRQGELAFACYGDGARPSAPARIQSAGIVNLDTFGFVVIARGDAAKALSLAQPPRFSYAIQTSPTSWDAFPNILGAGPCLVDNGQVKTTEVEEEFRPDVVARGPRTGVGWDKDHRWLLLVADGRSTSSVGLTLPETAALFQKLGAVEAMNLDGGSSTQLVVNGELINTPSGFDPVNPTRPREVGVINALALKGKVVP